MASSQVRKQNKEMFNYDIVVYSRRTHENVVFNILDLPAYVGSLYLCIIDWTRGSIVFVIFDPPVIQPRPNSNLEELFS